MPHCLLPMLTCFLPQIAQVLKPYFCFCVGLSGTYIHTYIHTCIHAYTYTKNTKCRGAVSRWLCFHLGCVPPSPTLCACEPNVIFTASTGLHALMLPSSVLMTAEVKRRVHALHRITNAQCPAQLHCKAAELAEANTGARSLIASRSLT